MQLQWITESVYQPINLIDWGICVFPILIETEETNEKRIWRRRGHEIWTNDKRVTQEVAKLYKTLMKSSVILLKEKKSKII